MKKKITYRDIVKYDPCYDPIEIGMPETYSDTIPNFIRDYKDRVQEKGDLIWLLYHEEFMSSVDQRLFSVWCAREVLKLTGNSDERLIRACDLSEDYAYGKVTKLELLDQWTRALNINQTPLTRTIAAASRAATWATQDAVGYAREVGISWEDQVRQLLTYFI